MTGTSDLRVGTWEVPQCPFLIEYAPAVLEEVRLAVVDAFFSLPRGGAEIGGVLFGAHAEGRVRILAYRQVECEHAHGPGFVLSERDHARLKALLDGAASDPALRGLVPVGWYHSHTRSEIFLSDLDLEIHNRYFPEMWQVALVLRPAGMKPTRAGFFFRGQDGSIQNSASYQEFVVSALGAGGDHPARPAAVAETPRRAPATIALAVTEKTPLEPADDGHAAIAPRPATVPAPLPRAEVVLRGMDIVPASPPIEMAPAELVGPKFLREAEKPPRRIWSWVALVLLLASGAGAYFTRPWWMGALAPKPAALHLQAIDAGGQLRIQWDRAALATRQVQGGILEITDGASKIGVPLDTARVRAGSFQYERRSEMVEVHLLVRLANQNPLEEFINFIGRPPEANAKTEDAGQQGAMAAEAEKARGDLKKQELRTLQLERSLEQMRQLLAREEERKRAENQRPGAPPVDTAAKPAAPPPQSTPAQPQRSSPPPSTPPVQTAGNAASPVSRPQPPAQTPAERPATQNAAPPPTTQTPAPPVEQAKPPAPKPAQTPVAPAPKPAGGPSLAGTWTTLRSADSASVFPPVAVTLQIAEKDGAVRGVLTGAYRVPKSIRFDSQVALAFAGPDSGGTLKMPYSAAGGSKGVIELIRLPGKPNTIEVVWRPDSAKFIFDDLFFRAR